jgi:hypothetical protein
MSRHPFVRVTALAALAAATVMLTADISQACHHRRRGCCYSSCSSGCSSCESGCSSCNTSCTSTESQGYTSNQNNSQEYSSSGDYSVQSRNRQDYNSDRGDRTARRENSQGDNARGNGSANNTPPSPPSGNQNFDQPRTTNPAQSSGNATPSSSEGNR